MAMQEAASAPAPSAKDVGNAFVEQYYHILHQSPGLVHKFYQDSSLLSRPDADGTMTTVTTMQAINDKILSLNYEDYTAEVKNADAQESYEKGVIVLVTGCLTGKDNIKKKFSQTFFLAPQDKGYFVLNDLFRFVGENGSLPNNTVLVNGVSEDATPITPTVEPGWGDISVADTTQASGNLTVDPATSFEDKDLNNGAEVCDPSDKEEGSVNEEEVVDPQPDSTCNITSVGASPAILEDAPKKSYASILKVMKGNTVPRSVHAATTNVKVAPINSEKQLPNSTKPAYASEAIAPTSGSAQSSDIHEEEGHSIYVRSLSFNATEAQLEEAFKKFGPIKCGGIQVRSNKQGFCFGFVEFETLSSMQSALEASSITVGDRQAIVEEKKTNNRVGSSGRGRYSSGRGGFRSDSFKNRGNFGGSRGYGRNEFRNQGEFLGRPKGSTGSNGEDLQRTNQNGSRRGGRQGGVKGSSASTGT
ncbi:nuclear transport factor 2 isoform X2 [Ricinus communis]|uniref:nuclear transport factor 2 isoform X2 n=1 Tax=Ricinus communis TaxID=3988 RepID=UPI00201A2AFC|nr:nuclear transport factor 2 isoform X2 [Ricinus communis]